MGARKALLLLASVLAVLLPAPSAGAGPGTISTVAGTSILGSCAPEPAIASPLRTPTDVAADPDGNLFVADAADNRICFVNQGVTAVTLFGVTVPPGQIAPVIGTGTAGFCGEGGAAGSACLNAPGGLEVDGAGNVYVADRANNRVRLANRGATALTRHGLTIAAGAIRTVAGSGSGGYCGDSGPATTICIPSPSDVALDAAGNLYVADPTNSRVRKVDGSGWLTRFAGNTPGFCGDGGDAASACLNGADGLAFDTGGNLYIADSGNNRVRLVLASNHQISTFAGNGFQGTCGDGGPATSACLTTPRRLAVDALGTVFISVAAESRLRRVTFNTRYLTTIAGNGTCGFSGDGGPALSATLCDDVGIDLDAACNLYVADTDNRRVRRIDAYDSDGDGLPDCAEVARGTDPLRADTDGDGLSDGAEVNTYGTDPLRVDTDGDGLSDGAEVNTYHTSPTRPDSDADSLSDGAEVNTYHTDPLRADTDGDGLTDGAEVRTFFTDPLRADTDGDGLSDGDEVYAWGTDPLLPDTDADGLTDRQEVLVYLTNPRRADTDGDGLGDAQEVNAYGTNPNLPDTDGDGLGDGVEVLTYRTDPRLADTDGDFLNDGAEVNTWHTDPLIRDTDGDALWDGLEVGTYGTNPLLPDTDGDGLLDGPEVNTYLTSPTNPDTDGDSLPDGAEVNIYGTSPRLADTDGDGLADNVELFTTTTNPLVADTDADGLADGFEVNTSLTNPKVADTDGDGLNDGAEVNVIGSNPRLADTDGDGLNDGAEVLTYGTSPTNPDSDGDTLSDGAEVTTYHTNPAAADTDADGLNDAAEVFTYATNPLVADTDADGLKDGAEIATGTNPLDPDTDHDGLSDGQEVLTYHSNPLLADTDGDGLRDGDEVHVYGTSPVLADTDGDGFLDPPSTSLAAVNTDRSHDNCPTIANPDQLNSDGELIPTGRAGIPDVTNPTADAQGDACDPDDDNDGLSDAAEVLPLPCPSASGPTDHLNPDTDGDGVLDGVECAMGTDPANPASRPGAEPPCSDPDGDGIRSALEVRGWGSDPQRADSDGDGKPDGLEIMDVNGNSEVGLDDAVEILKAVSAVAPFSPGPLSAQEKHAFDVNRNGLVDLSDAVAVVRYMTGQPAC